MLHFSRLAWLVLLASMAPRPAVADIEFTAPAAGASLPGGSAVAVQWKDSGSAPAIADLASYQLMLCAGGNDEDSYVRVSLPDLAECAAWGSLLTAGCATDAVGHHHGRRPVFGRQRGLGRRGSGHRRVHS